MGSMALARVVVDLFGWEGGPGVNVYHFEYDDDGALQDVPNLLQAAYSSVKTYILSGVSIQTPIEAVEINVTDGVPKRIVALPPTVATIGTGSDGSIPRGTQANVRHFTDAVHEGRRLNGRNFIGPLAGGAIDGGGNISSGARAAFSAMFDGLQDLIEARLMVYHRERKATEDRPYSAGYAAHVQSSQCLTKPANLRGRRD